MCEELVDGYFIAMEEADITIVVTDKVIDIKIPLLIQLQYGGGGYLFGQRGDEVLAGGRIRRMGSPVPESMFTYLELRTTLCALSRFCNAGTRSLSGCS